MNSQQRTPKPPRPLPQTHISVSELYKPVSQSLQRWGRYDDACYDVFQPVVDVNLKIVEKHAQELVELEMNKVDYHRDVTDLDRQKAVWSLLNKGVQGLEPSWFNFDPRITSALQTVRETGEWPQNLPVPLECRGYVALMLIYVKNTKTSSEAEKVLDVPKRTFCKIRKRAIREIVHRLLAWERHGITRHQAAR